MSKKGEKEMYESTQRDTIVVGVGNRWRRDDGVGCRVATLLQEQGLEVIDAEMVPENFLEVIIRDKPARVLFVDACDFGGTPGEFRIFTIEELEGLKFSGFSTHTLPLKLLAELINTGCGAQVWFLGIQPDDIAVGEGLSHPVESALPQIVDFLRKWLKSF
ncbi:MAG: hydrogenase 3 maturation endopeptidase HyCI [bacterium]